MSIASGAHALLVGLVSFAIVACGGSLQGSVAQPADLDAPPAVRAPVRYATGRPAAGPQPEARVSGRLVAHDGRPLLSATVTIGSLDGERPFLLPTWDITISPDWTFEFRNIPAGRYEIRARGETEPNGTSLFAAYRVIVDGRTLDRVSLTLVPGAILTGTVNVERSQAPKPPAFGSMLVRAPLADGSSFGDALTGLPGPDGTFSIRGLMAGSHVIRIDGLQYPWVLKSVLLRGEDVTDTGLETESSQPITGVQVNLTDIATDVSGTVRDALGHGRAGVRVLVVPLSPRYWSRTSRRLRIVPASESGEYRIRGLPAGEYRLAALVLDEVDVYRSEVLKRVAATGVVLNLEPRAAVVVDLTVTPPAFSPVQAARR